MISPAGRITLVGVVLTGRVELNDPFLACEVSMRRTLAALLLLVWLAPAALAQPKTDPPKTEPADAGASVYQKVVHSTAWVHSDRGDGKLATGSGSLIDKGRRLVLTNYHVVGDVKNATVYFAVFEGKKAIPDRKHYLDRASKLGIPGEVVEIDKQADLALIRIDRVPDGVVELPLAADSPDPGQAVHSLGNPGKSGALWVYTPGKVRQVYNKKWKAKLDEKTTVNFEAKVIETDSPTNPGDSGGPLVNDKGELVGVTQGGALDAQAISIFVDLSEVKRLMKRRTVQALRSDTSTSAQKDPPKKEPAREKPLNSRDDGKFFSEEAWKKVAPAAEKLLKEKGTDLFVETIMTPWKGDVDKIKAMKPEEREKFFKELADERAKEVKLKGVYILVCKNPSSLYVIVPHPDEFPPGFATKVKSALLDNFKDKKFDEGLQKAIDIVLDSKGLGEKK
jgi:S1-C subfamily serine protease